MATTGIWTHPAAHSLAANATAQPAAAGPSASNASNGSNISANDFLTLLVTEMQNQDPTANTDPNEYINQLVQVNSLEQLISINQTLSTDLGASAKGGMQTNPVASPAAASPATTPRSPAGSSKSEIATTTGNLALPPANAAAQRVAQALTHGALNN